MRTSCFLLSLLLSLAIDQAGQPATRVPAAALAAADDGPLPMAFVLAHSGVPIGVVTSHNPSDPAIFAPRAIETPAPADVDIADVVARFVAKHPDHAVTWRSGVLSLEETGLACSDALDRLKVGTGFNLTSDMPRLLSLLSWSASGEPPPVPEAIISTGGRGATPSAVLLPPLHFVLAANVPLRLAFDAVARQNRGGVWIVWQHTRDDGAFGCRSVGYYADGLTVGASSKDFWTIERR